MNDETLSERIHSFFLRNATTSAIVRICVLTIKLLIVAVYLVRTATDQTDDVYCCERIYPDAKPEDLNSTSTECERSLIDIKVHTGRFLLEVPLTQISAHKL